METVLRWANALGSVPTLPQSLLDVNRRGELLHAIDGPLAGGVLLHSMTAEDRKNRLEEVSRISREFMPDVEEGGQRLNLTLRLWAGWLMAAKTIALETRSGPNTPTTRRTAFSGVIDKIAQIDPIFQSGVEAAPAFKELRQQPYSLDGVPEDSAVRLRARDN